MLAALRLLLAVFAILLWWATQRWLGRRQIQAHDRIGDVIHNQTESWHRELHLRPWLVRGLLIFSSLILDALGLFLIFETVVGSSIRPLLGLVILFSLRQVNQALTALPPPETMIWRDPGVPSLFVTYGVANDLFFSGHTALAVFGALEIGQVGGWPWGLLGLSIAAFEIATVLILRAHWTMDVFTGAITALWTHDFVSRVAAPVDQFLNQFVDHYLRYFPPH